MSSCVALKRCPPPPPHIPGWSVSTIRANSLPQCAVQSLLQIFDSVICVPLPLSLSPSQLSSNNSLFPLLTFSSEFPHLLFIYKFAIINRKIKSEISFLSRDLKYFGGVMYGIRHTGCYQLSANKRILKTSLLITAHYKSAEWIWVCNIRLRGSIDGITASLSNDKKEEEEKKKRQSRWQSDVNFNSS